MNGFDYTAIGNALSTLAVAVLGAVAFIIRNALARWQKAQETERNAQAQRAQAEKAEYRQAVKKELRRGLGPVLMRLTHLEGAVDVLLRAGQLQPPVQLQPPTKPETPTKRKPRSRR